MTMTAKKWSLLRDSETDQRVFSDEYGAVYLADHSADGGDGTSIDQLLRGRPDETDDGPWKIDLVHRDPIILEPRHDALAGYFPVTNGKTMEKSHVSVELPLAMWLGRRLGIKVFVCGRRADDTQHLVCKRYEILQPHVSCDDDQDRNGGGH